MERFYSIEHLSTTQLRELFSTYRDGGWVDFDYYKLMPEGVTPPQLPDELILHNINGGNEMNMLVFMLDHEDEQDGIMIGFGLTEYRSLPLICTWIRACWMRLWRNTVWK